MTGKVTGLKGVGRGVMGTVVHLHKSGEQPPAARQCWEHHWSRVGVLYGGTE